MIFEWHLCCFKILYQLPRGDALGRPIRALGALSGPKKQLYVRILPIFSTPRPILDPEVSLDRVFQDLKLCLGW